MDSALVGDLVSLRGPRPSDGPLVVKWRNASRQHFFNEDPITLTDHRQFMRRRDGFYFVVERVEDRKPVGVISLYNVSHRHGRAEYGRFLIAPQERRRGYGTEALRLLLEYAFGTLGLHRVYGDILVGNEAAIALDIRLGFRLEGIFRDHVRKNGELHDVVRMAILRDGFET